MLGRDSPGLPSQDHKTISLKTVVEIVRGRERPPLIVRSGSVLGSHSRGLPFILLAVGVEAVQVCCSARENSSR